MEAGTVKTLMSLAVLALLIEFSKGETHVIGAPNGGWDTSSNLQSWAKAQKFSVGDSLSFQYGPPHSVFEVNEADYNSCQTNNPIKVYTDGSTLILLTAPGKRYFICGTSNHCALGMKLEVDITTTSQSPPPPNTTPPASPSTLTPPPQPSLMPPPSPSTLTAPPHPSPQPAISSSPNISPSKPPASTSPRVPTTESRSMEPSESPQLSRSPSNPPQPHISMANDDYLQMKLPIGLAFGLAMILAF